MDARLEAYHLRMQKFGLKTLPTPGLVSGDFCSTNSKRPKVGKRMLLKRKALWNRCLLHDMQIAVRVFRWATTNKKFEIEVEHALQQMLHEKEQFEKVGTVEGHRILSFLDPVDRYVLLKVNPVFEDSMHQVIHIDPKLSDLCEEVAEILKISFSKVYKMIEENSHCWFYPYRYNFGSERLAEILRPHFLGVSQKKKLLLKNMEESFTRWNLNRDDMTHYVRYWYDDIVDVELYSASCFMSKHGNRSNNDVEHAIEAITSQVMHTPGLTWKEACSSSRN